MTGVTPETAAEQLAFDNWFGSVGLDEEGRFDHDEMRFAFEAGMQATQQPQPAPEVRALLEEALFLCQNGERAPGGRENWRDWGTKAELALRGLPATSQAAPGVWTVSECLERISVLAGALHEIKGAYTPGTMAHDTAHAALDESGKLEELFTAGLAGERPETRALRELHAIADRAGWRTDPQPADVGTAWRLLDQARGQLQAIRQIAEAAAKGEAARLHGSPKEILARAILDELDPQ